MEEERGEQEISFTNIKGKDVKKLRSSSSSSSSSSSPLLLYCVVAAGTAAVTAAATAVVCSIKPRDPIFHLISINLTSFKLHFPLIDAELILTVHVTNPNNVPIMYSSSLMSIFYDGSLFGSANVEAGSQPAKSCKLLKLPARLDGVELVARHVTKFLADVVRREMVLDAVVDIEGTAKVMWWGHRFKIHVDSHIIVDPIFLDVIDQENRSKLEVFVVTPTTNTFENEEE